MSWNNGAYFSGPSGNSQYSSSADGYGGGGQHEAAAGGKKRPPSHLKKPGGKKAEEDYPSYTNHDGYNDNDYNGGYNGYGSTGPYNNGGSSTTPYYGGGRGGYNSNSSYGHGGDGYTGAGGAAIPYNAPASFWAPQDGTRSPMFISTKEVNVYAMPGSPYDDAYGNDQKRRGSGGGLFRPALEAVGHFFDRKFGFNNKD